MTLIPNRAQTVFIFLALMTICGSSYAQTIGTSVRSQSEFTYVGNVPLSGELRDEIETLLLGLKNLSPIQTPEIQLNLSTSHYFSSYDFQNSEIIVKYLGLPQDLEWKVSLAHEFGHHVFGWAMSQRGLSRRDASSNLLIMALDELFADTFAVVMFSDPEAMVYSTGEIDRTFGKRPTDVECLYNDSHCILDGIRYDLWNNWIKPRLHAKVALMPDLTQAFINVALETSKETGNVASPSVIEIKLRRQLRLK